VSGAAFRGRALGNAPGLAADFSRLRWTIALYCRRVRCRMRCSPGGRTRHDGGHAPAVSPGETKNATMGAQ